MSEPISAPEAPSQSRLRPPFDPEVLEALQTSVDVVVGMSADDVGRLRATAPEPDLTALMHEYDVTVHEARGVDENRIPIVLIRPRESPGPVPVIYFVHGGGMVVGCAYDLLPEMAALAERIGAAVASVEYRLAPEHVYPAAVEDVYSGLVWLTGAASTLGLDASRTLIAGVSAGGGLAAATALLARDRNGPELMGQMLLCPMLDDRNDSDSGWQMVGAGAWDRSANETGWSLYLGARADVPIYAAPARADDLRGLPPAFIDVGSAETFRDEDVAYAARIWVCGGDAELHVWPGGSHSFDGLAPDAALSRDAREARARWLDRLLSRSQA